MFKLDLEKSEDPDIKLPTGFYKKQESSRKTSTSSLLTMLKPLTMWITTNCGKFFKRWKYQTTLLASWEICMQVKKQQLEPDMEQWMDWFQIWKEVHQGCILSPCLFNLHAEYIMQNEAQAGIKIAGRNINNLRYADDTILIAESKRNWRASWCEWKRKAKKLA